VALSNSKEIAVGTASGVTWYLKLVLTETSYSVANNTSTVKRELYLRASNTQYTISFSTRSAWIGTNKQTIASPQSGSSHILISDTVTVKHNNDGSGSYSIGFGISTSFTLNGSNTCSLTLTKIPRATTPTLSASSINLGEAITINTPRLVSSYTHKLYYKVGSSAKTEFATGVTTSYKWEDNLFLANWINNSTSGTVTIYCQTYSGSTYIGEKSVTFTGKVPETIVPVINSITINEATEGIVNKFNAYVKEKSTLNVVIDAEGDYASTIKTYRTTIDNVTYVNSSFKSEVLRTSGTIEITTTITDSRGRTATKTEIINVLDYYAPKITGFGAYRCNSNGTLVDDETGTYLKLYIGWDIAPVDNKNDKKVVVEYREKGTETWNELLTYTDLYTSGTGTRDSISTVEFDVDKTYEIRELITDYFTTEENPSKLTKIVEPTYTLINYHESGTGVAFNKVATRENAVQFGEFIYDQWDTVITNGLAVYGGDPDTTLESLIMTSTNSPNGEAMYFHTFFSSNKSENQNCGQVAIPYYYNGTQSMYWRYRFGGEWSEWVTSTTSGSNENGSYIKHSDGTLICIGQKTLTDSQGNWAFGGMYRSMTVEFDDFPIPFVGSVPKLSFDIVSCSEPCMIGKWNGYETTLTAPSRVVFIKGTTDRFTGTVSYTAIGRWK